MHMCGGVAEDSRYWVSCSITLPCSLRQALTTEPKSSDFDQAGCLATQSLLSLSCTGLGFQKALAIPSLLHAAGVLNLGQVPKLMKRALLPTEPSLPSSHQDFGLYYSADHTSSQQRGLILASGPPRWSV